MLHQNIGDSNMAMIYLADSAPLTQASDCDKHCDCDKQVTEDSQANSILT